MEIVIPLAKDYERPTIEANGIKALVDTGSMIPVLSLSGDYLEKEFAAQKVMEQAFVFDLYGGHRGDIYRLPEFHVGGIVYAPLDVFVPEYNILTFWMLICGSMFHNCHYSIDMTKRIFTVEMAKEKNQVDFRIIKLSDRLYPQVDGEVLDNPCPIITEGKLWGL